MDLSTDGRRVSLTPREIDVLKLVLAAQANKEIAFRLGISQQTVKSYLSTFFQVLGIHSRMELMRWAWQRPAALELMEEETTVGGKLQKKVRGRWVDITVRPPDYPLDQSLAAA